MYNLSMTLMQTETLQKPKIRYEGSRQDHGTAAQRHGHDYDRWIKEVEGEYDSRGLALKDKELISEAYSDDGSVSPDLFDISAFDMNADQLEAAADAILGEPSQYSTHTPETPTSYEEYTGYFDEYTEDELDAFEARDAFLTEADFGIRSKHEIGREMARRVTLDVAYDEDDNGDGDFHIPVHITTRP